MPVQNSKTWYATARIGSCVAQINRCYDTHFPLLTETDPVYTIDPKAELARPKAMIKSLSLDSFDSNDWKVREPIMTANIMVENK